MAAAAAPASCWYTIARTRAAKYEPWGRRKRGGPASASKRAMTGSRVAKMRAASAWDLGISALPRVVVDGRSLPFFLAVRPRHRTAASEDQLVRLLAGPHGDLVAVRIDGDGGHSRAREHQGPRRRRRPVHQLVRSGRTRREADEVSALQGVLAVRRPHHDRAVDDEQPFLPYS